MYQISHLNLSAHSDCCGECIKKLKRPISFFLAANECYDLYYVNAPPGRSEDDSIFTEKFFKMSDYGLKIVLLFCFCFLFLLQVIMHKCWFLCFMFFLLFFVFVFLIFFLNYFIMQTKKTKKNKKA